MNVKKVLMVLISLCLVCGMAGAVSAEDMTYTYDQNSDNYTTESAGVSTLTLNTSNQIVSFTLSIPDNIEMIYDYDEKDYRANAEIILKVAESQTDKFNVTVSVASENGFSLYNKDGTTKIVYPYSLQTTDWRGETKLIEGMKDKGTTLEGILFYSPYLYDLIYTDTFDGVFDANLEFVYDVAGIEYVGLDVYDKLTFSVAFEDAVDPYA